MTAFFIGIFYVLVQKILNQKITIELKNFMQIKLQNLILCIKKYNSINT